MLGKQNDDQYADNNEIRLPRRQFLHNLALIEQLKVRACQRNIPRIMFTRKNEITTVESLHHAPYIPGSTGYRSRGRCGICDRKKNRTNFYGEHVVYTCAECLNTIFLSKLHELVYIVVVQVKNFVLLALCIFK